MYVVTNTLRVPAEHAEHIEKAFSGSGEHMKQTPGCLGFQLLREVKNGEEPVYIAMTTWEDEASFKAWMTSDDFRRAHANAGDSPASGEVHQYEVVVGE